VCDCSAPAAVTPPQYASAGAVDPDDVLDSDVAPRESRSDGVGDRIGICGLDDGVTECLPLSNKDILELLPISFGLINRDFLEKCY
jgi:hypothetical protein